MLRSLSFFQREIERPSARQDSAVCRGEVKIPVHALLPVLVGLFIVPQLAWRQDT